MIYRTLFGLSFLVASVANASVCLITGYPTFSYPISGNETLTGYQTAYTDCDGKVTVDATADTTQLLASYIGQGYKVVSQSVSAGSTAITWTLIK